MAIGKLSTDEHEPTNAYHCDQCGKTIVSGLEGHRVECGLQFLQGQRKPCQCRDATMFDPENASLVMGCVICSFSGEVPLFGSLWGSCPCWDVGMPCSQCETFSIKDNIDRAHSIRCAICEGYPNKAIQPMVLDRVDMSLLLQDINRRVEIVLRNGQCEATVSGYSMRHADPLSAVVLALAEAVKARGESNDV